MWVSKAIPKVKCFIWRASHQAIPIQIVLEKRDIPIMSRCDGTEDVSHALMLSYWVTRAWFGGMSIRWGSQTEPVWNAWMDSLQKMSETGGEHGEKHRLQGDTLAWEIWKERCQTMHNGENPNLRQQSKQRVNFLKKAGVQYGRCNTVSPEVCQAELPIGESQQGESLK